MKNTGSSSSAEITAPPGRAVRSTPWSTRPPSRVCTTRNPARSVSCLALQLTTTCGFPAAEKTSGPCLTQEPSSSGRDNTRKPARYRSASSKTCCDWDTSTWRRRFSPRPSKPPPETSEPSASETSQLSAKTRTATKRHSIFTSRSVKNSS